MRIWRNGRRAGFKSRWDYISCRFESCYPYYKDLEIVMQSIAKSINQFFESNALHFQFMLTY